MKPYPPHDWERILSVKFETSLTLTRTIESIKQRKAEDADYVVVEEFSVSVETICGGKVRTWTISAPEDFHTDLSSVPKGFRWIVGRTGTHLEASVLHDYLYAAWHDLDFVPTDRDRYFADRVFLKAMEETRVGWLKRWIAYYAVQLFGKKAFRRAGRFRPDGHS